jgi:5,10-methylenetetrahydromethanopterin reductase
VDRRKPLKAMRELVTVFRQLVAMETVTFHGEFVNLTDVRIDIVHGDPGPKQIPVYLGATGDQMLELGGEICDGVLMNYLVSPKYNEAALQRIEAGACKAGRTLDDVDRPQLIVVSMDEDRDRAIHHARELVTQYLGQQPHIMKASGVSDEVLQEISRVFTWPATPEQVQEAVEARIVPDEVVQLITASGTPDEVRAKVQEYVDSGCTCPVLYPLGDDVRAMIDVFARS